MRRLYPTLRVGSGRHVMMVRVMTNIESKLATLRQCMAQDDYGYGAEYCDEVADIIGDLARTKDPAILEPLWFIRAYNSYDYAHEIEQVIESCAYLDANVWIPRFVSLLGKLAQYGSICLISEVVFKITRSKTDLGLFVTALELAPQESLDFLRQFVSGYLADEDYSADHGVLMQIKNGL